jgi:OOP family OmpA-OmpF porin
MKNKLFVLLIFLMGIQISSNAQIRLHLKEKIHNQAESRANRNANDLINKGFDKVENGVKGLFKKKKKNSKAAVQDAVSKTQGASANIMSSNANTTASSTNATFQKLDRNALAKLDKPISDREMIFLSNPSGIVVHRGDVFVYKTSEGNYGKLEMLNVDKNNHYNTTFRYITYANDGSILSQSDHFTVRGTYTCDLDHGTEEGTADVEEDFQIGRDDATSTRLGCYNDAAIVSYKPAYDEIINTNKPKVVWAKYDFVPGQTVIFEDGPAKDEENGEFPSRWDLYKGNAEIGEVNGENVIMFLEGGTYIVPYLKNSREDYLPDVFTMEMDVWFTKGSTTANRVYVYLGDKKNQGNRGGSNTHLTIMPHSLQCLNSEKDYPGTENVGWAVEKTGSWRHIAIAYTKGKFKAYFNDTRLINIPHLETNPSGITIESGNDNIFIKNIRIAKGGVKYYDRVLSDGKIVENGIRFDVNKASLKPESMGPINKIYKLMTKYPDLKFSVEGHTDSDGDEALNQKLSVARAKAVMDKLIAMGISADRLKYTGYGESKPVDTNATPEGRANNRRVEFVKF